MVKWLYGYVILAWIFGRQTEIGLQMFASTASWHRLQRRLWKKHVKNFHEFSRYIGSTSLRPWRTKTFLDIEKNLEKLALPVQSESFVQAFQRVGLVSWDAALPTIWAVSGLAAPALVIVRIFFILLELSWVSIGFHRFPYGSICFHRFP